MLKKKKGTPIPHHTRHTMQFLTVNMKVLMIDTGDKVKILMVFSLVVHINTLFPETSKRFQILEVLFK